MEGSKKGSTSEFLNEEWLVNNPAWASDLELAAQQTSLKPGYWFEHEDNAAQEIPAAANSAQSVGVKEPVTQDMIKHPVTTTIPGVVTNSNSSGNSCIPLSRTFRSSNLSINEPPLVIRKQECPATKGDTSQSGKNKGKVKRNEPCKLSEILHKSKKAALLSTNTENSSRTLTPVSKPVPRSIDLGVPTQTSVDLATPTRIPLSIGNRVHNSRSRRSLCDLDPPLGNINTAGSEGHQQHSSVPIPWNTSVPGDTKSWLLNSFLDDAVASHDEQSPSLSVTVLGQGQSVNAGTSNVTTNGNGLLPVKMEPGDETTYENPLPPTQPNDRSSTRRGWGRARGGRRAQCGRIRRDAMVKNASQFQMGNSSQLVQAIGDDNTHPNADGECEIVGTTEWQSTVRDQLGYDMYYLLNPLQEIVDLWTGRLVKGKDGSMRFN